MGRNWRLCAALISALSFCLAGDAVAASAGPNASDSYKVTLAPFEVLPWDTPVGQTQTITGGRIVFELPLAFSKVAVTDTPRDIEVGGLQHHVPRGDLLAATATGGELASLRATAMIFCAPPEQGRRRELPQGEAHARYEAQTQLCLVDGDGDGQFERAFLAGTKFAADRKLQEITPLRYRQQEHAPMGPGYTLRVVYLGAGIFGSPTFRVTIILDRQYYMLSWYRLGNLERGANLPPVVKIKTDQLPQPLNVVGTEITVMSIDQKANTAVVRFERPSRIMPLDYQYIILPK